MSLAATSRKGRRDLTLLDLQNVINKDESGPELYHAEFERQLEFFQNLLTIFELNPKDFNQDLSDHIAFLSHVAKSYPQELQDFPETLVQLLKKHSTVLDADLRMECCKALILLRRKNLLPPSDLLILFFDLFKCQDKILRNYLKEHIIYDIRTINAKQKDNRLNTTLQNFMFKMLQDSHKMAAKMSLDVMIELYQKGIWHDQKTVNVISTACFHDTAKLAVTALKFFLGNDLDEDDQGDDSEDDMPSVKNVTMANRFNKKTRKREKFLDNIKKAHKKKKKKGSAEAFNFSALHLINDPQGFAERLFKKVDTLREGFEVKVLFLDLISRLIGTHELFILNFYQYMARFLNPHQREVIPMLQFVAQASHELVPPDAIEPALRAIVNNFVTERNSGEVMAIGLNSIRELCKRCPLAMDETLLRDLAAYKTYKDKAVMMAAKSLITLYRHTYPDLLHKKDRGRPTEAQVELGQRAYGALLTKDFIPGAEDLKENEVNDDNGDPNEDDSEGEWEDVVHSSDGEGADEESDDDEEEEVDDDDIEEGQGEENSDEDEDGEDEVILEDENDAPPQSSKNKARKNNDKDKMSKAEILEEKRKRAAEITTSRILTDADFKHIDATQLRKQVQAFRKGGQKRKLDESNLEDVMTNPNARDELVDLAQIEMVHKKRKHDKETRMASIKEGREGRDKFGSRKGKVSEHASSTHKEKNKKKNFMMMKHKLKRKAKRSFVDKARDLKKSLMRRQKFK
ncbi:hypothetical protein TCAL_12049 [Tigriopus californicus]|uniref:Protein SDA1 n=1 Tax=Tigriopus californicus TaxID=6832 RepID=A0A553PJL4_TIGCA|nr:protein SDA1 homolog [Tigriopus californicus]TRY77875.1 hypothetical protein TCAL_12049 [Tigriopus californicus]|eukprot:TCALIF_12049-PA protein Name:"Similar to sdad1 Protein SDA1 homolog (Nematostella vectensis)" AED:0.00 eAED:0.00 QI:0/-1/0/1/-1/1/1/0/742